MSVARADIRLLGGWMELTAQTDTVTTSRIIEVDSTME